MKKYVFITPVLSGLTGSQRYVNYKCGYLRENGWDVIVLWNYNISPVELENVKCFDDEKYIHHELRFYPSWFSKRQRDVILDRLVSVVGIADQIVIESNQLELGAWGELLAKRLRCKHVIFITTEGTKIGNLSTFNFCYSKLQRMELFSINEAQAQYLFSNFTILDNSEKYYWSASMGVDVEEYYFPVFDQMSRADFTITHFGREKGYFSYMLSEVRAFITRHQNRTFNLFFLGELNNEKNIRESLNLDNVNLLIISKNIKIIPKQIFVKSDVVIATAGCANIASENGGKVISMDVNRNVPLGLLRYTTLDSNTYSGKYINDRSLGSWLQALLIEKIHLEPLKETRESHSFDYQMQFVEKCDCQYLESSNLGGRITRHDKIYALMTKMGLFHIVEFFYYNRRGVSTIKR